MVEEYDNGLENRLTNKKDMLGFKTIEEFTLDECEAFLRRDNVSSEERKLAEQRRDFLQKLPGSRKKTIMEEFLEYGFVPAAILGGKKKKSIALLIVGGIMAIVGIVQFVFGINYQDTANHCDKKADYYYDKSCEYEKLGNDDMAKEMREKCWKMDRRSQENYDYANTRYWVGSCVFTLGLFFSLIAVVDLKFRKSILAIADYYPMKRTGKRGIWVIFVKDRKFGLLKRPFNKVIIPAQYEKLSWQQGNILKGEESRKCFLMDRKGKRITRNYDRITWRDKTTFETENDGREFLIDIYGNELS